MRLAARKRKVNPAHPEVARSCRPVRLCSPWSHPGSSGQSLNRRRAPVGAQRFLRSGGLQSGHGIKRLDLRKTGKGRRGCSGSYAAVLVFRSRRRSRTLANQSFGRLASMLCRRGEHRGRTTSKAGSTDRSATEKRPQRRKADLSVDASVGTGNRKPRRGSNRNQPENHLSLA
jgi:hypothetical protein